MDFFRVEISEIADKLDISALGEGERASLLQGLSHNPQTHDIYRVLVAALERDAPENWKERHKKRKKFSLVDRILVDMRPVHHSLRVLGIHPTTTSSVGNSDLDLDVQANMKILKVADANLKFSGPIKNWWRKKRPLVVATRTDRVAQWVYSRQWIETGDQCRCELLVEVPKNLPASQRLISCFADFKDAGGRAVEKGRRYVKMA